MKWIFILSILILGLAFRFFPHPANFSALGSIALFAGFLFPGSVLGFLVPTSILVISDLVMGFYPGFYFVYFSFLLVFLIGSLFAKKSYSEFWLPAGSVLGALIFFVITNFGHWLATNMYPVSLDGLALAYLAGLPFLKWGILGDLIFSSTFLALYLVWNKFFISAKKPA